MIILLSLFTICYSCEPAQYSDQNMDHDIAASYLPTPSSKEVYDQGEYLEEEIVMEQSNSSLINNSKKVGRKDKTIKRGYIQIRVMDVIDAKEFVNQIVASHNSHYENESYSDSDYESNYSLVIRIPAQSFSSFVSALEAGENKITSKQISAENVTAEYFDIKVALENKERYLEQYRELLKKTGSVKDLLEVQERIRRLSEEMDVSKGRLAYLDDNVNYSTLNLTLTQRHERIISKTPINFGQRIINAFKNGGETIASLLIFLVGLWPFILIGIFLLLIREKLPSIRQVWGRKKS